MAKNPSNSVVGDSKMLPLRADASSLKASAEMLSIPANSSPVSATITASENIKAALAREDASTNKPQSCKQKLWLSFFFDGTGNNLEADLGLLKHSNVARLYRVHRETDPIEGIYRFYIPGIGTYFKDVGDNGGKTTGNAFGAMGQARLNFALSQFDETLARPIARAQSTPSKIEEINIAVFGFSRGAALARAFVSMMMETRCTLKNHRWKLNKADAPVNFRFMGLFDTVASVGNPMSRNNTDYLNPALGDVADMIEERLEDYPDTSPHALAFSVHGAAGADPGPGIYAGHDVWGARMAIHDSVMEVRHFIAAHELRNSFPVDSISIGRNNEMLKPAHFYETIYPGSHSDVGGGYAPGEGARAILPSENFCLIPLRHMYDYALNQGVPLLPIAAPRNVQDFEVSDDMRKAYNEYSKFIGGGGSLGQIINKHRELYFAWHFSSINRKLNTAAKEKMLVKKYQEKYVAQEKMLATEVAALAKLENSARAKFDMLTRAQQSGFNPMSAANRRAQESTSEMSAVKTAREQYREARDKRLKAEAKRNAVPNMEAYEEMLSLYNRQLIKDVESINSVLHDWAGKYQSGRRDMALRPHYKAMLKAYENEFQKNNGLSDGSVIEFFDLYIHDSLAGFAKDATLPSDPRVVYIGGDRKLRFAHAGGLESNMRELA